MVFDARVVKVLIASPSDVAEERDAIEATIHQWNAQHADNGVVLLPVRWEIAASAESGSRPQAIVNRQIVDDADVLLGVFWTRLGTSSGAAASGTVEEIQQCLEAGIPVSLFFSSRPVVPASIDTQQLRALRRFESEQRGSGLVGQFGDIATLTRQVASSLTRIIREHYAPDAAAVRVPSAPRAHVTASVRSGADTGIILVNDGAGEAQQVAVRTEDLSGGGGWLLMDDARPLDFIPPGQTVTLRVFRDKGSPPRVNCFVDWVNEDGTEGSSRQSLQG